jgi:hypothetical protein
MEIPRELFYLSALFFATMAVVAFIRAHREKERFYYAGGGLCLLYLAWSILFILDQVRLAAIPAVAAIIVSVVMLPELNRFQERRMREVDIEGPMRMGDFFFSNTYSGWLKLAYRHGLGVTVILYFLLFEVFAGGMLLVLNLLYDLPSSLMLGLTITGIIMATLFYRQIKRALTTIHLPPSSPTEK